MTAGIAVIVGSGLSSLGIDVDWLETPQTRWGPPSSPIGRIRLAGHEVLLLARHGRDHSIAPHVVNYRANVWALRDAGVRAVIGANIVGAIAPGFRPGDIAVPEQLIDYTWGREATFGDLGEGIPHIDFTVPFDPGLRGSLAAVAADLGFGPCGGIYGVTQGPRLETAAEIDRLDRDGCAMVGMTAMPEASLAREAGLSYAIVAAAVNYAAGRSPTGASIHQELAATAADGMRKVLQVIEAAMADVESTV